MVNLKLKKEGGIKMVNKLMDFFKDEEGATAVEYGIMVAAIAAIIITIVIAVGQKTNSAFTKVDSAMGADPLGL
jgi:pilus assembly protein Flp/PilA